MTVMEFNKKVWAFYLRLEDDFLNTLKYVDFSQDNFATFSIEYEKQLLAIGSEIDVLCKLLCKEIAPTQEAKCITQYAEILCNYQDITNASVHVSLSLSSNDFTPFSGWTPTNSPAWWKAYNAIKHQRTDNHNYKKGNLENVFLALSALYILNRYYCKLLNRNRIMNEPDIKSSLFTMVGWRVCIPIGNGFVNVLEVDGSITTLCE